MISSIYSLLRRRITSLLASMTVLLLLNQVAVAGGAFIINLFSTSVLSPEARGEMAFYLQLAFVLQTLVLFGSDRSFIISYPREYASSVARSFIRVNIYRIVFSASLAIITLALAVIFRGQNVYIFLTLVFFFVSTGIFGVSTRVAFIVDREKSLVVFLIGNVSMQLFLMAGAFFFFLAQVSEVILWVSLYPLGGLIYLISSLILICKSPTSVIPDKIRRELIQEGWKLYPLNLTTFLMQKADRLLLPFLASTSDLGRYVFVVSILELISWPVTQWIDTQVGRWREKFNNGQKIDLFRIALKPFLISALLAIFICFFTYFYIRNFLSPEYQEATILIIPLAVAIVLKTYSRLMGSLLIAAGRVRITTVIEIFGLAVSITLFFVLIPVLGALGASLGLLISSLVSLTVRFGFIRKKRLISSLESV